jgi:hypothetical protein
MNVEDKTTDEKQFYEWMEQADEVAANVANEFYKQPDKKQSWRLVPAPRIIKIWKDFAKFGFVRDEKGLDQIAQIMIENTQKLHANTIFMEHEEMSAESYAEGLELNHNYDPELYDEKFPQHVEDEHGQWRISDVALAPLVKDSMQLMAESDPTRKLLIIDRMLNRIHARSDIAALFIEGGTQTLNQMFAG